MAERRFSIFVERSLDLLMEEAPLNYRYICTALGSLNVLFEIDRDTASLSQRAGRIIISRPQDEFDVRVVSKSSVILELVDGIQTMDEVIMKGQLHMWGSPVDLVQAFNVLTAYLEGAVRGPSLPALLAEFRTGT